jgi:integrase
MVKIRPRGKHFQYDILFRWPDGEKFRERANAPVASKSAAERWAKAREAALLAGGKDAYLATKGGAKQILGTSSQVPTFKEFWPDVVRDHYKANRKKASTLDAAVSIYDNHLAPRFDAKRLDQITTSDIAALKGDMADAEKKTVNNVMAVLSRALKCAIEWGRLPAMPCKFGFFKIDDKEMSFYEVHVYRALVAAARKCGLFVELLVLLAGSAGLRRGEIQELKWTDIDFIRKQIRVERNIWRKVVDTTKGGRHRIVPLTPELAAALHAYRHLKGPLVLYSLKGKPLSNRTIRNWLARAQKRANLEPNGGIHILRHTFCSHLAMAGVPVKAIQELAGHRDIKTTMKYMHLSPANRSTAMTALAAFYKVDSGAGKAAAKGA